MLTSNEKLIHETAIVSPDAKLGKNVQIGAYSIIGPNVKLGDNNIIGPHVVIEGHTTIGSGNKFFQFSSIGADPQDYSYKGEPTRVTIGDNNLFREFITVNCGTLKQDGVTIIGDNSMLMAYVHIGHDAVVGSHCTLANTVNIAGHVNIGDRVILGGGVQVSQFVTLGRGSYIGGASAVDKDIPSFCTAVGNRVRLKGINIIGMRRQDYSRQVIAEVVDYLRLLEASALSPRSFVSREENISEFKTNEIVLEINKHILETDVGIAPFAY